MDNPAKKTEYKALDIIAQKVKQFEQLHYLDMAVADNHEAIQARTLLEGIIQRNGYKINYNRNSKKSILKIEKQ